MNNSASNKSSTQPSEERRKKWDKTGHEQEIADELVACGKDSTNTSYSGMTALIPVLPSYSGSIVYLFNVGGQNRQRLPSYMGRLCESHQSPGLNSQPFARKALN